MSKIWLVTQREFLTRVKKRSFIIMSLLGPILIAGFFAGMFYLASTEDTGAKKIAVVDETSEFLNKLPPSKYITFVYCPKSELNNLKKTLPETDYYGILYISSIVANSPGGVQFFSYQQPSLNVTQYISSIIEKELRDKKLIAYKIENIDAILKSVETHVSIETVKLSGKGDEKKSNTDVARALAYVTSFLIYTFILVFGVQVMRGVMEEKTSRIVEVIISSVKPFQLMMGKVLGVALTAITQFLIWIVLSTILVSLVRTSFMPDVTTATAANQPQNLMEMSKTLSQTQPLPQVPQVSPELANAFAKVDSINFYVMVGSFLFYFVAGYLLYASLFAAVGAAVDSDSDTQQFVIPIMLPLIAGIMVMISAFQNPDTPLAFWFSMIPFTSPIVMMARIPYGVPYTQIAISMSLLVITFVGAIWVAGKVYRTGILMYGNKASFKEMIKWLRYKN